MANPDGSPRADEAQLLDELQRVQRDIAAKRKRRLEQQLALARQQLQDEENALRQEGATTTIQKTPPYLENLYHPESPAPQEFISGRPETALTRP